MPLQPSVPQPQPPAGSSTASSYLYNQHQHHQLHPNSQPQHVHQHPIYSHPISSHSRSSLSLSYAPGPSSSSGPAPPRPSYPQHHQQSFRRSSDEYTPGVDVAAWVKGSTTIPAPEQGTSRAHSLKGNAVNTSSKLSMVAAGGIAGIAGPATSSPAVTHLSKSHNAPPPAHSYYHQHGRSDSHSSIEYPFNLAGPETLADPYDEGWRAQEAQAARGWGTGSKGPAYVFPVLDRASVTEHLSSHHHHQTVPPMMSYGLPAHSPSSSLRQSGSAAAGPSVSAMQEFAGGGTSGTSHSAASPLEPPLPSHNNNNNGSSHDPASSGPTLDVYNSQPYGHHLPPPLDEYHHPPPPPSRSYPTTLRFPQPYPSGDHGHYTIPPPHTTTVPGIPEHVPVSTRASISSNSSSTMHSHSPPTYPVTPSHSQSPEQRPSSSFVHTSPTVAHNSVGNSPVVSNHPVSADVSAVVAAQRSSGSPEAAPRLAEPGEELNLIPEDGTGGPSGGKDKQSIFECPGCDLTFTRLSALKQHMLSHTGEKPHACDHCGRRFSLASNLRRHTTTKACKVLKFQAVKENISGAAPSAPPTALLPAAILPTSTPTLAPSSSSNSAAAAPTAVLSPVVQSTVPPASSMIVDAADAPKKDKKRKATSEKPSPRRKRHANFESRWIPRTLALFKNAHLLTSTPPFQFCVYRAKSPSAVAVVNPEDEEEDEPFTRPTLPLHPVRPSMTSRASIRSMDSVGSAVSSGSSSSSSSDGAEVPCDDGSEERDSYEEAPEYPYHPMSWSGKLPGPGMLGGDELVKNPSVARRWMTFKR
ncbi:hypothetical protein FRC04_001224 [Tulasnella sp. 424]|nr:hypothetical protein FRC04_001224 [Tulasnella sp. 424]KAG8969595.1 hypothetical protein FRC05_001026 [Tulasnella sp. 425]